VLLAFAVAVELIEGPTLDVETDVPEAVTTVADRRGTQAGSRWPVLGAPAATDDAHEASFHFVDDAEVPPLIVTDASEHVLRSVLSGHSFRTRRALASYVPPTAASPPRSAASKRRTSAAVGVKYFAPSRRRPPRAHVGERNRRRQRHPHHTPMKSLLPKLRSSFAPKIFCAAESMSYATRLNSNTRCSESYTV
jgi:hypothetical protein